MAENQLFTKIEEARAFAQAIIDTVREPYLGARPRPASDRREPLFLSDIQGRPR